MGGAVLPSQKAARAFDVQQGEEEGPAEFLERLRSQMRKYSGLEPTDPLGQSMLKLCLVTNSWSDIARKLPKRRLERQVTRGVTERGTESVCEKG